jgi:hypothetical protein
MEDGYILFINIHKTTNTMVVLHEYVFIMTNYYKWFRWVRMRDR